MSDELAHLRRFVAAVYDEDCGLSIWHEPEFADIATQARADHEAALEAADDADLYEPLIAAPVVPPIPVDDRLVDLMAALEESVREAKAEREAQRTRGPRLVPRRDPHLCWRVHPGTGEACQLPNDHDIDKET